MQINRETEMSQRVTATFVVIPGSLVGVLNDAVLETITVQTSLADDERRVHLTYLYEVLEAHETWTAEPSEALEIGDLVLGRLNHTGMARHDITVEVDMPDSVPEVRDSPFQMMNSPLLPRYLSPYTVASLFPEAYMMLPCAVEDVILMLPLGGDRS